jgi:hypothetical protein
VPAFPRLVRTLFKRELIPARFRWWFAAEGMCDWYRVLAEGLAPHLGEPRTVLAAMSGRVLRRRRTILAKAFPHVENAELALLFGALYRVASQPDAAWIFDDVGRAPRSYREHLEAERLIAPLAPNARWEEVTTHLGELLIALTDHLPDHMPRARPILGEICFDAGVRYATKMKRALGLPGGAGANAPALAIEVLRHSEYVFRVNPEHWGEDDAATRKGWLEGNACPWFTAPGWNGAHCGIFGQFQSGICSVFGLKYHLSKTIPKHGGDTCRVDIKPIPLRIRNKEAS